MKIRKLAIAALLTMGLVLTGCNNKKSQSSNPASDSSSGSQVQPVSTIDIVKLTRALVVGESINLDDHVSVVGGEGPKVYTATIKSGESVVSLEGKTLTAIGEGSFRVEIAAGDQTANFQGTVLSALKVALQDVLDATSFGYGLQGWEYDSEDKVVPDPNEIFMRQSDYEAEPYALKDDDGKYTIPGGMLKAQNGKTYEFKMDDMTGAGFEVLPEIDPNDFNDYYCNYDIPFTASDTETVKTDEGEFLVIDSTVPAVLGDSRSANLVDDANVVLFGNFLNSTAAHYSGVVGPLVVTPLTVGEGNEAFDTFDISIYITIGETQYLMNSALLLVGEHTPTLQVVRDYIDAGHFPAPLSFAEFETATAAAVTAKNYSYQIQGAWLNPSTYAPVDAPESMWGSAEIAECFFVGTETAKVSDTAKYAELSSGKKLGFIEHDSKLYSFSNKEEEGVWGDTLEAKLVEDKTTLWGDLADETLAWFSKPAMWTGFEVNSREEDSENHKVTLSFTPSAYDSAKPEDVTPFTGLFAPTFLGYEIYYVGTGYVLSSTSGQKWYVRELFNVSVEINTSTNEISVLLTLQFSATQLYALQYSIYDIGTTVMPDLSSIVYPA